MADTDKIQMQPIALEPGTVAETPSDLVAVIIKETDRQVAEKAIEDTAGREEFAVSSDALNYRRVLWRYAEELELGMFPESIAMLVRDELCALRGYDRFDFERPLLVVAGRARLPFGWSPMEFAQRLADRKPIRLLHPELAEKPLPTKIANIAYYLQIIQKDKEILLPIDQIRALLAQRKVIVAGTVHRLVEAGILKMVDSTFRTGKAASSALLASKGSILNLDLCTVCDCYLGISHGYMCGFGRRF